MKRNEDKLQSECIKIFRLKYPHYYWRLFAIPNGGKRNVVVATQLKAQGLISGVWDLLFSVPMGKYSGLFLEAKYGKNDLTPNQIEFQKHNEPDYCFKKFYTVSDFLEAIDTYLTHY